MNVSNDLCVTPCDLVRDIQNETKKMSDRFLDLVASQIAETSVAKNSSSQDPNHQDDLFQLRYVAPGFKPFSYNSSVQLLQILRQNKHIGSHQFQFKFII